MMKDEIETVGSVAKAPGKKPEHQKKIGNTTPPPTSEKMCFVITKNKSNSWADDLYACTSLTDLNRVYH